MSRTAASLLREALEEVGVRYTFGIPGVHNTEIYDELDELVEHHAGAGVGTRAAARSWPMR